MFFAFIAVPLELGVYPWGTWRKQTHLTESGLQQEASLMGLDAPAREKFRHL
jgi:hypothetical protein